MIAGWLNNLAMWLTRFAPRALMPWIAARALGGAVDKVPPALPGPAPSGDAP